MPIIKSAKKKMRRDKRRTLINRKIRQQMKLAVKKMRQKPSKKTFQEASRFLDRAAKKGVIHKGKASRLKSRLSKLLPRKRKKTAPAKKRPSSSKKKPKG